MRVDKHKKIARYAVAGFITAWLIGCESNQGVYSSTDSLSRSGSQANLLKTKATVTAKMQKKSENSIEALSEVSFNGDTIRATVISNGCTHSDDFQVAHDVINGMCQVSVIRTKPDLCRRVPFEANIELSWTPPSDCAGLPVTLANPLLVTPSSKTLIKRTQ